MRASLDIRPGLGPEMYVRASQVLVGDASWSRLGAFSFKDEDIVAPELLLSACLRARDLGLKPVVILWGRGEPLNLLGRSGLRALLELSGGVEPLYLGVEREGPLSPLGRARISMDWLATNPGLLAETITTASPVRRDVEEVDLSSTAVLSELLVKKLGPPSFKEDLAASIKGADKVEATADAIYAVAAVVNPPSLVATGLKYAAKLFKLVRERRREEYKAFLDAWRKNVEEGFSEENVGALVGDDGLEPVKASIEEEGMAIVVHGLIGTLHELFLPLFVANVIDELRVEGLLLAIDGASHLSRFGWMVDTLASAPEERGSPKAMCYIHTEGVPQYQKLPGLMRAFFSERAAVFDLSPSAIEALCEGRSAAFRASLLRLLEEAVRERLTGKMAFVLYDAARAPMPELVKVKPGALSRLKAMFGRLRARRD